MWCSTVGCLVTLILSLLAVPLTAVAQQTVPVLRIGICGLARPCLLSKKLSAKG